MRVARREAPYDPFGLCLRHAGAGRQPVPVRPEAPPYGARHGAECHAPSLKWAAKSSLSLAARSTRPRWKGATGRDILSALFGVRPRVLSSAVERCPYKADVGSSTLSAPTRRSVSSVG